MKNANNIPNTEIRKPIVKLAGSDGNAFAILGVVIKALRRAGAPQSAIAAYQEEAISGDYNHLLATTMKYVEAK